MHGIRDRFADEAMYIYIIAGVLIHSINFVTVFIQIKGCVLRRFRFVCPRIACPNFDAVSSMTLSWQPVLWRLDGPSK